MLVLAELKILLYLSQLDLASGQDGMGADLGLGEYELHSKDMLGGGEFQGLGLSFARYSFICLVGYTKVSI